MYMQTRSFTSTTVSSKHHTKQPPIIRQKPCFVPVLKPRPKLHNSNSSNTSTKSNSRNISPFVPKAMPEWMGSIETIGHGIVYFTIFYSSMNWIYYYNTRKDVEKVLDDKDKKDTK